NYQTPEIFHGVADLVGDSLALARMAADAEADVIVLCGVHFMAETAKLLNPDKTVLIPDPLAGCSLAESITGRDVRLLRQRYTGEELRNYRKGFDDVQILAHPECPPDVLLEADFVGSTSGMIKHLDQTRPARVVMITECSMSDNVAVEFPQIEFIRPCALCPHMKRITLPKILRSLQTMEHKIEIDPSLAERARRAVERMVAIGRGSGD